MIELIEAQRDEAAAAGMNYCRCTMSDPCPIEVKVGMAPLCSRAQLLAHKAENPKCVLTRQRLFSTIRGPKRIT